jgi:hypothetical protein
LKLLNAVFRAEQEPFIWLHKLEREADASMRAHRLRRPRP